MRADRALSREAAAAATKVVVDTTRPRRPTKQSPHIAQTLRAGACRGAGFVAVLAHGAYHVLRPASRHHPRQAARRARAGVLQRLLGHAMDANANVRDGAPLIAADE